MNKEWSEKNKEIQKLLSKEATFGEAIKKLIEFREELFQQITWIVEGYPEDAFDAKTVKESSDKILLQLQYKDLKRKFGEDTRQKLIESKCVSIDENAFWLIDYRCGKDVKGLIQMPFSRHWIMHIEAMLRIKNRL